MIVIPKVMGICIWSPKLDMIGNSSRGIEFCKKFGETFNFHIFDSLYENNKFNTLNNKYNSKKMNLFYELCMSSKEGELEHLKLLFNRNIDFNQSDYDSHEILLVDDDLYISVDINISTKGEEE